MGPQMRSCNNLKNLTLSDTYWRVQLKHILKCSGSQFFRSTTGIQSVRDAIDESRFAMTFLNILGVMEICSFRLVLKGKTGKEMPQSSRLEFFEKFLANNFALSDAEDNTSGLLSRGGTGDLRLLRTLKHLNNSWEVEVKYNALYFKAV